jgi:hypothetical protein
MPQQIASPRRRTSRIAGIALAVAAASGGAAALLGRYHPNVHDNWVVVLVLLYAVCGLSLFILIISAFALLAGLLYRG